jgi:hypothetical protein
LVVLSHLSIPHAHQTPAQGMARPAEGAVQGRPKETTPWTGAITTQDLPDMMSEGSQGCLLSKTSACLTEIRPTAHRYLEAMAGLRCIWDVSRIAEDMPTVSPRCRLPHRR